MTRGGFSWKRAVGISAAKSRISRRIGVPLTRSGRQRKMGAMAGCLMPLLAILISVTVTFISFAVYAHPGGLDANGGHYVRTPGWGYPVGSYHYHRGGPASSSSSTSTTSNTTISRIEAIQQRLNDLGYDCGSVDGIVGKRTRKAVMDFQRDNGLVVDGIVGPKTFAALEL